MRSFGPYVIEAELARGGAGIVFRARDPNDATGTPVAIKVLLRRTGQQEARATRRMEREMRLLERLRHPAIVSVRATGEAQGGALWIAMDLVEGRSLQERLDREGPLPVREAASLLLELARALAHAHAEGVLHRDLKPANVLLDRAGRPFLADFGLAKDLAGTLHGQSLSATGQFLGTPGYWPPEQARGEQGSIGRASDVYGLGALLYAMLTGEPPSGQADSLLEALAAVERDPPPPSRLRPDVPAALDAICARCLRRAPADRYDSADDVAAAVQAWLAARRGRGRARRRVAPLAAAAAALLLVAGAAGALALRQGQPDAAATRAEPALADVTSGAADSPLGVAARELARLMAAGDPAAVLAFIDALPPEVQANEQMTLSRALVCLELGLLGVTNGSRPEGEALLERAADLGRASSDPDVRLVGARALSALGRHDDALAAFAPLLEAPGDLGAPLFHGALAAGERAFPEASRSFFSPPLADASETLRAARHMNSVVDVPADDVAPRDRARAYVGFARALHASQILMQPDALDTAVSLAPDDPVARLARAERNLTRTAQGLDGVEADLRVVSAQEVTLRPEERARLALLSGLLELERLIAQRALEELAEQAQVVLRAATETDAWTLAAVERVRARRARALDLPGPLPDRPLTGPELARLGEVARLFMGAGRHELFVEIADALPARAREQAEVVVVCAATRVDHAYRLDRAGARQAALEEHERALALVTPPRESVAHLVRADALAGLGRLNEAVVEYQESVRLNPNLIERARANGLVAARAAFPVDMWASFLVPGPRAGTSPQAAALLRALLLPDEPPSAERLTVFVSLARSCHARGDPGGAADMLRAAAAEAPADEALLFARAEWHLGAGRLDDAEVDLRALNLANNRHKAVLSSVLAAERALAAGEADECLKLVSRELSAITPEGNPWLADVVTHVQGLRARAVQAGGGGGD